MWCKYFLLIVIYGVAFKLLAFLLNLGPLWLPREGPGERRWEPQEGPGVFWTVWCGCLKAFSTGFPIVSFSFVPGGDFSLSR